MPPIPIACAVFGITVIALVLIAWSLHLLKYLGAPGRRLAQAAAHAPLLDVIVLGMTLGPLAGAFVVGMALEANQWYVLLDLAAAIAGQIVAMNIWIIGHELAHRDKLRGPKIVKSLNRAVGPLRNNMAVWWTTAGVPLFGLIRLCELIVYPPLVWLIRLPRYNQSEWVNVSRHKFDGLVGYDRIWCLYCDWMTGIWALGSEMLRNIESFWCPIQFTDASKCENCKLDFPDVVDRWVKSDTDIAAATAKVEQMYPAPDGQPNAWFGHPTRLTVEGKPTDSEEENAKG